MIVDLTRLLRGTEGKTLEFKRGLDSPAGVLRTLVAFANTAGGKLLIGVEDGTRAVCGVADPMEQEERLASLIADSIEPRLLPDMEILPWRQTQVIAVTVYPSPNRPHHLRREGAENGTYVRIGSTNRRADAALIGEMRRYALGEGYDEQPMPELDSEAIDFRVASESFAPLRKLTRGDLATLRLTRPHQGRCVPSIGGLLLFGRDRLQHFPDAWIQVGRFAGTDKARILDHAELRQMPLAAVDAAIAFVQKHLHRGAEIGALRRTDRWTLPPVALIEQWGSGIQRMSAACLDAGLAVPELEEIGMRFRVTFALAPVAQPRIDPLDQSLLDLLTDNLGHTTAEIARHIGRTPRATRTRLLALLERGLVREIGTGPRDPQRRYYLTLTP